MPFVLILTWGLPVDMYFVLQYIIDFRQMVSLMILLFSLPLLGSVNVFSQFGFLGALIGYLGP